MRKILLLAIGLTCAQFGMSLQWTPDTLITFKTVDTTELKLHCFFPDEVKPEGNPAVVFFHGGGWISGDARHFYPYCDTLAKAGITAFSAEYTLYKKGINTPKDCVRDGKSAIRYVREHACELGIDPDRIGAGGGSAGGQIAAATATVVEFDDPGDNLNISPVPNLLVLFNPVFNNGPEGWNYNTVKDYWEDFSPYHNIRIGHPPTIILTGTADNLVPVEIAEAYQQKVAGTGVISNLKLYVGAEHGFFNAADYRDSTLIEIMPFLEDLWHLSE